MSTKEYNLVPLKGWKAFDKVFKQGKISGSKKITVAITRSDTDMLQFGVGVSKKICKKAVIRNRIKRLIRESLRQINKEKGLPLELEKIIIFWKDIPESAHKIKLNDVKNEIIKILERSPKF